MSQPMNGTEIAAAFEAGARAADIDNRFAVEEVALPDGKVAHVPLALDGQGNVAMVKSVVDYLDGMKPGPDRRRRAATLAELDSFVDYVNRYKNPDSIVYADVEACTLTAVIDEHPAGAGNERTAWRDHRAHYSCPRSPQWETWTGAADDEDGMAQEEFAAFLDENLADVTTGRAEKKYPPPADLLKLARDLSIHTKGEFSRSIDPTTGAGILVNKTEIDSRSTPIPKAFAIAIPVFLGGTVYEIECRIRFSISGRAFFAFTLHNRELIVADAFGDIRKAVASRCELPVLAGAP